MGGRPNEPLSSRGASFTALKHRRFRLVLASSAVSAVGDWMQIAGRAVLVYEVSGKDTSALGLVYFMQFLPQILFNQLAGVLADRNDRRRILIVCQLLNLVGSVVMGVLVETGTATVGNVAAISGLLGIVLAFQAPAGQALVPALLPEHELASGVALMSSMGSLTRVFGPLLASITIAGLGLAWIFWLNAVSFVGVLAVWFTTRVTQKRLEGAGSFAAAAAAARFARRTPIVAISLVTVVMIAALGNVYAPLGVAYTTDVLANGKQSLGTNYYGVFQSALGIGAVTGIMLVAGSVGRRPGRTLVKLGAGTGVALVLLALVSHPVPAFAVALLLGGCHVATPTLALVVIQSVAPDEMRGRLTALHTLAWLGPLTFLSLGAGWVSAAVGVPATFALVGGICLVYCVPLAAWVRRVAARPAAA